MGIAQGRHVVCTCMEVMALPRPALGGSEPSESQRTHAKKIKCCSLSSECGSRANLHGFRREGFQAGESDPALEVLDCRNL